MRKTPFVLAALLAVAGICVVLWPVFTGQRLQADTDEAVQSFLEERKPEQQYPELLAALQEYNGSYPGYGMNVCKPQDGSVIRVRYTLALGKDIGGFTSASGSYGVSSGNYYKEW